MRIIVSALIFLILITAWIGVMRVMFSSKFFNDKKKEDEKENNNGI